jgi:chitodextrinase
MARLAGLAVAAALLLAAPAQGAIDRTAPTKPGDLHVTAKTTTSVSLAWTASRDSSDFRYEVQLWQDPTKVTLPKTATSYTWTGLNPGVQYYFSVWAIDVFGNKSVSDLAVVETVRDRTAPGTPPNVRVTNVTASKISVAWDAAADDTGVVEYQVLASPRQRNTISTGPTSADLIGLSPQTSYAVSVRARDFGWNFSPWSAPVTGTTPASTDTTPPTAPSGLRVGETDGCGEVLMKWTQSTDDQDPQAAILYHVTINGQPDVITDPVGVGRWITYGTVDGPNTFVVTAIDSAGNVSAPSNAYTLNVNVC